MSGITVARKKTKNKKSTLFLRKSRLQFESTCTSVTIIISMIIDTVFAWWSALQEEILAKLIREKLTRVPPVSFKLEITIIQCMQSAVVPYEAVSALPSN